MCCKWAGSQAYHLNRVCRLVPRHISSGEFSSLSYGSDAEIDANIQDNGRLALFNKRGAVCLTFADLAKLQDFTKAFLSVHHEVSGSSEKDGEKGGFAGGLADSEVDLDLADSEVDLDLADSEVDLDLTESEVYLTASDIVTASVVDGGESGWDFCV